MRLATSCRQRLSSGFGGLLLSLVAGFSANSMAGTVELSPGPPAATTTVAPNLVLTFDDSGSMNWHHMPDARPYDGKGWNTANDGDQGDAANRTYRSQAAPFLCAGVITPGITDPADPRSWSMNGVYYNPDNTYEPPMLVDGKTAMPDASYTGAWNNGIQANRPSSPTGKTTTTDLSKAGFCGNSGGGYYKYTRAASTLPTSNGQLTSGAVTNLYANKSGDWTWVSLNNASATEKTNFANWFAYYRTRTMAAVSAISRAYAPFGENMRVAWQNINSISLSTSTGIYKFVDSADTGNVRTRFYNWLFAMPADQTSAWLTLIVLYPFTSALPQEIAFRTLFFHRYQPLLPSRTWFAIAINAALFGFAHIIYQNPVSVLLTCVLGVLLGYRYTRTRSLWLVWIEHTLYGELVFTVGLGHYFLLNPPH